jgi:hypothetical protein
MPKTKPFAWPAVLVLLGCAAAVFFSGRTFRGQRMPEPIFAGGGLSAEKMLSGYFPELKNTRGDTEVYVFEGRGKGGTVLILGGTHANEPAGFVTAVLLAENLKVSRGRVIVIPRANASAFSHSDPQEANPQRFSLTTASGDRWFRLGSRLTNPVDQWPDPTLYVNPAGQFLSGPEVRNLNRCYPGRPSGYLTEKVAFGIMELIRQERVDLGLDLHESAPEYPVINALVFHENSADLASLALLAMQAEGYDIRLEASPQNLRGLSHREWGDFGHIKAVLIETANASHGRLKGKPTASLIVNGKDKFYVQAARRGRLFVPFDENGIPLKLRVARHLAAIKALLDSLGELEPGKAIAVDGLPGPAEVERLGAGAFLRPPR